MNHQHIFKKNLSRPDCLWKVYKVLNWKIGNLAFGADHAANLVTLGMSLDFSDHGSEFHGGGGLDKDL